MISAERSDAKPMTLGRCGSYELLVELAAGGMATVYLGRARAGAEAGRHRQQGRLHEAAMRGRAAALSALVATALAVSCSDEPPPQRCTSIPAGGCPLSHGVACEDPACEAVYRCLPGNQWELDRRCPAREGGAPADAGLDAPASLPRDADVDAPPGAFGGPGCAPLMAPDCALGTALLCGAGCCGCEDLFVCDDGWLPWGRCGEAGPVPR